MFLPPISTRWTELGSKRHQSKSKSKSEIAYRNYQLWSELIPVELLERILKRLSFAPDCIRFGAVCKLWHTAFLEAKRTLNPSLPLILLLSPEGDPSHTELVDVTTAATKLYNLPSTHNNHNTVIGSSFGWLVTIHKSTYGIQLLNPITRARIPLPPATTFANFHQDHAARPIQIFTYKVVLSSSPDADTLVMAIHGQERQLSFCRIGEKTWTSIELTEDFRSYQDVIYHKGQFYAVTESDYFVVCEFDPVPKAIYVATIPYGLQMYKKYLFESSGNLFMATRYYDWENFKTSMFDIHKLDIVGGKMDKVTSLDNQVLFLGNGASVALLAHEAHGCKPNSIYYLDDNWDWYMDEFCRGIGVYNWDNYKHSPPYSVSRSWQLPLFWFTPAPW